MSTFDYPSRLEWIRAQQNPAITGPPGTAKSHMLVGCGHAAVNTGFRVRYFMDVDLADGTVGKIIDTLLWADCSSSMAAGC